MTFIINWGWSRTPGRTFDINFIICWLFVYKFIFFRIKKCWMHKTINIFVPQAAYKKVWGALHELRLVLYSTGNPAVAWALHDQFSAFCMLLHFFSYVAILHSNLYIVPVVQKISPVMTQTWHSTFSLKIVWNAMSQVLHKQWINTYSSCHNTSATLVVLSFHEQQPWNHNIIFPCLYLNIG